ncbi:PqiB family protein [Pigmentiphaga litoralis]|uniref:Paraquat-inducible protein B n=1 Tax=Pigmentiphaga litoralis TaxID=516702 RepID=A0A7Y9IZE5_9BURK|nr:MlaD family protein [Pigmentiphaga litoralis]NYE26073.1 paraquat-inducible protein B [Pigmentiphaga litoralis]NYE85193.1 paraquat-inducible protein B [Pigmentiphaga litoralis]
MTQQTEPQTTRPVPEPARRHRKGWLPSLVWLIPIVAAVAGLSFMFNILSKHGPSVDITFRTAEGLEAGKTKVRYKDVDIGQVQSIRLVRDRTHVIVNVELTKDADTFAVEGSRFWVVKPRVAASGVTGLNTLLSGAYIGVDPGKSEERVTDFTGLEVPPIVTTDTPGKQFVLRATDLGSLDLGSPVYYRRINVGQVVAYDLDPDGTGITLRVFVNAPYDKFVTANTRFWHASGVNVQLNADGLKLQTQSLATVVLGGVSFQASPYLPASDPAANDATFALFGDQDMALKPEDGAPTSVVMYFEQSVRGLSPGAPVDFRGVVIGQVRSIGIEFRRDKRAFVLPVVVDLYPQRLGLGSRTASGTTANDMDQKQIYEGLVRNGMRAQLRNGNLLTGQMYVAIDFFPGTKAPTLNPNGKSTLPEFPTVPGTFNELQTRIAEIVDKIGKFPFDTMGQDIAATLASLRTTMATTEQLVSTLNGKVAPEITATMQDARATLRAAEQTFSSDAPLQQDVRRAMQELMRTSNSLRQLTDYLEQNPQSLIRGKPKDER